MKCKERHLLTEVVTASMLLLSLAVAAQEPLNNRLTEKQATAEAAQNRFPSRHAHYAVYDVGTFGGPTSGYTFGSVIINARGAVVGVADTSVFDPNCGCFVTHAFRWEDGVTTDLGALPGGQDSFGGAISAP
jgi:probable HAF family extracellular repeat protein